LHILSAITLFFSSKTPKFELFLQKQTNFLTENIPLNNSYPESKKLFPPMGGVVASGKDSDNISHTLFKNAPPGSDLKFGDAGNLDDKPGTDGGAE
jgi:hypothetical protein